MRIDDMYVGQVLTFTKRSEHPCTAKDGARVRVVAFDLARPTYVRVQWLDSLANGLMPDGHTPQRQKDGNYDPVDFDPAEPVPTTIDEIERFLNA